MNIRERIRNFGILVIRMFWPGKGSKSIQRLGILILGIGAMIGVSQASTIGEFVSASLFGQGAASEIASKTTGSAVDPKTSVHEATTSGSEAEQEDRFAGAPNIVDLIDESELIVQGMVKELTDGFENGVPYTQVTVDVSESLKGKVGKELTFRQFGLLEPKRMGNGRVNLNVTPAGWAKYKQAENVVLFVGHRASLTGLRTTVGLGQGKLEIRGGNIDSQFGNVGMFDNVVVDRKLLNDADKRVLATRKGPVNKDAFLSLVRKAVNNKWVEGGKLRHAKK